MYGESNCGGSCFFIGPLYHVGGTRSSRSDDGSSPEISLLRPFSYFGHSYSQIYVCLPNFLSLRQFGFLFRWLAKHIKHKNSAINISIISIINVL